mgnify:FL=1
MGERSVVYNTSYAELHLLGLRTYSGALIFRRFYTGDYQFSCWTSKLRLPSPPPITGVAVDSRTCESAVE